MTAEQLEHAHAFVTRKQRREPPDDERERERVRLGEPRRRAEVRAPRHVVVPRRAS